MKFICKHPLLLPLVALVFTMFSCSNDEFSLEDSISNLNALEELSSSFSKVEIKDGILSFPSREMYSEIFALPSEDIRTVEQYLANRKDFKSFTEAYESLDFSSINPNELTENHKVLLYIMEESGEYYFEPIIQAYSVSVLANNEGLIRVGNKVWKFFQNEFIEFDETQLEYARSIDFKFPSDNRNVVHHRIVTEVFQVFSEDVVEERTGEDTCFTHYNRNDNDTAWENKVVGTILCMGFTPQPNNFFTESTVMLKTENRRRCVFGAWCNQNGGTVRVAASGQVSVINRNGTSSTENLFGDITIGDNTVEIQPVSCLDCRIENISAGGTHEANFGGDGAVCGTAL